MDNPAKRDDHKRQHDQQRGHQSQFLADVCKNKVRLDFRQVAVLLHPVPQPHAQPAAGAKAYHRLLRLTRRIVQMLLRMQPGKNAVHAHRIMPNGNGQRRHAPRRRQQDVPPAYACHQQQDPADRPQQDGRAAVRFHKDQAQDQRDEQARDQDSPFERLHLPLAPVAIPSQRNHQPDFAEFGRLKHQGAELGSTDALRGWHGQDAE